jgi:hypothetical protein
MLILGGLALDYGRRQLARSSNVPRGCLLLVLAPIAFVAIILEAERSNISPWGLLLLLALVYIFAQIVHRRTSDPQSTTPLREDRSLLSPRGRSPKT